MQTVLRSIHEWILDSNSKNFVDSGFRILLLGANYILAWH